MLYMLAVQAATRFVQLPRKPPVTTTLIAVQTLIYLRPGKLDAVLPTLSEVCLNPYFVVKVRAGSSSLIHFCAPFWGS
jgi:rhomboid domain-containing protein 1